VLVVLLGPRNSTRLGEIVPEEVAPAFDQDVLFLLRIRTVQVALLG